MSDSNARKAEIEEYIYKKRPERIPASIEYLKHT